MKDISLSKKILTIALWVLFSYFFSSTIVDTAAIQDGLFILLVCAGLWMSEIIPLPVTALLVPVIAYFLKYCLL